MADSFVIAVASGKGGTGKTTVATNLALLISRAGKKVQYVDCDVEEPNGHIFLKPAIEKTEAVTVAVPQVELDKCTGCGKCGEICQYSAIVAFKKNVLTFEQLCHSCGGCMLVCPTNAIKEKQKEIGSIDHGSADSVGFVQGRLQIGDVRSPALIRQVRQRTAAEGTVIIDAPPGTSCPVIEAVKGVDFVLLVTEPTPFGLNDLMLAVGMVRELKLPFAVVINRSDVGDDKVRQYCRAEEIDVALEIPDDRRIAEAYSRGDMVIDVLGEYQKHFADLAEHIEGKVYAQRGL
ncbi:MAG: (4Fe-4S)-binding protein [Planctomycetota bacterium]|nr:MAG: (4Fe-4S)-binding protein [Planctomycetota bacterium]